MTPGLQNMRKSSSAAPACSSGGATPLSQTAGVGVGYTSGGSSPRGANGWCHASDAPSSAEFAQHFMLNEERILGARQGAFDADSLAFNAGVAFELPISGTGVPLLSSAANELDALGGRAQAPGLRPDRLARGRSKPLVGASAAA